MKGTQLVNSISSNSYKLMLLLQGGGQTIQVGSQFSHDDFCKALRQYSQENNVLFTIVDSKTVEAGNMAASTLEQQDPVADQIKGEKILHSSFSHKLHKFF